MGYQLGIDLGTTYTAAAVCRSSDGRWVEPEVVTLGTRAATIPSVLFVAPDGSIVVGEAAERRALTDPERVVREFKRRIGDPTPLVVAGTAWAPEDLSARLVRWVVDRVAEREGGAAARIALTHPASWGQHKTELLAAALGAQGLTVAFLAEPQAAALHYAAAERVPAGATIAVYDLGGGTFDAAVVRKADRNAVAFGAAGFGLLGRPEGLDRLGGVDFDEVVFEHVQAGLPAAFAELDDADQQVLSAVARVRRECTEAKEALSADTEVSIPVLMPAARGSVRLHRSEFEGMIRPQVEDTVEALRAAVRSAGCTPDQLSAVLLVGGSSRIPLVAQLVSERLGRPVAVDADPKNAIAKGAALAVSPKPTASWPDVAIPPVPAGPGPEGVRAPAAAGPVAAAAALAGAAMPAARMPAARIPAARMPAARIPAARIPAEAGFDAATAAAPVIAAPMTAGAVAAPPRPPRRVATPALVGAGAVAVAAAPVRGLSHESSATLLAGARETDIDGPPPAPPHPIVRPGPDPDWDYDPEPERRRRGRLFVGVGAIVAGLAVIAAVLLAQRNTAPAESIGIDPAAGGSSSTTTPSPAALAPAPPAVPAATPNPDASGSGAGARAGTGAAVAPAKSGAGAKRRGGTGPAAPSPAGGAAPVPAPSPPPNGNPIPAPNTGTPAPGTNPPTLVEGIPAPPSPPASPPESGSNPPPATPPGSVDVPVTDPGAGATTPAPAASAT